MGKKTEIEEPKKELTLDDIVDLINSVESNIINQLHKLETVKKTLIKPEKIWYKRWGSYVLILLVLAMIYGIYLAWQQAHGHPIVFPKLK